MIKNEFKTGFKNILLGDYTSRDMKLEDLNDVTDVDAKPFEDFNMKISGFDPNFVKERISLIVKPNKSVDSPDKRWAN